MRRILFLIVVICCVQYCFAQISKDTITQQVLLYASKGDVRLLRPLYDKAKNQLSAPSRLYCDLVLSHAEGDIERMVACIDSLMTQYPASLNSLARMSLINLKGETLLKEGAYTELIDFSDLQLQYMKRHRYRKQAMKRLQTLKQQALSYTDGTVAGRIQGLIQQRNIAELTIYEEELDTLPQMQKLLGKMLLADAFNNNKAALSYAETLLKQHADSLSSDDLKTIFDISANELMRKGDWQALSQLCQSEPFQSKFPNLIKSPQIISEAYLNVGKTSLTFTRADASLQVSRYWPLMTSAQINNQQRISLTISTAQQYTLLSTQDVRNCGLIPLNDTIVVYDWEGPIVVSPVLVPELACGDIVFRNLLCYAVLPVDGFSRIQTSILGTNELRRLGRIEIYKEKWFVKPQVAQSDRLEHRTSHNIYWDQDGRLLVKGAHKKRDYSFILDMDFPSNTFSAANFSPLITDTTDFQLQINFVNDENKQNVVSVKLPNLSLSPVGNKEMAGIIGYPFIHSLNYAKIDFETMNFSPLSQQEDPNDSDEEISDNTDAFMLERNLASRLLSTPSNTTRIFLRLLAARGKNDPEPIIAFADTLLSGPNNDLSESQLYLVAMEATNALAFKGEYKAATDICKKMIDSDRFSGNMLNAFMELVQIYDALQSYEKPLLKPILDNSTLDYLKDESIKIRINGKSASGYLDPTEAYVIVSEKVQHKFDIQLIYSKSNYAVGIIKQLKIGDFIFENSLCRITKENVPTTIGYNVLRLIPEVEFSSKGVTLSSQTTNQGKASSLRFDDELCVQVENQANYIPFRLVRSGKNSILDYTLPPITIGKTIFSKTDFVPADFSSQSPVYYKGTISMEELIKKQGKLVFDFQHMIIR